MTRNGTISLDDILYGVGHGRVQSVGNMEVIPLIDEDGVQDEVLAPPVVNVGTSHYGTVDLHNTDSENPTFVPPGAGWVVKEAAQDHAIGSGEFLPPSGHRKVETAMCIQESQGGLIGSQNREMLILPPPLRAVALAKRKQKEYSKLWNAITAFGSKLGVASSGNFVRFVEQFKDQLDTFVAQFELVPKQIGAMVLINGKLVGIEMAPSEAFWQMLWRPLIRVCYGGLSLRVAQDVDCLNREPLQVERGSLDGIAEALAMSNRSMEEKTGNFVGRVRRGDFILGANEQKMGPYHLTTVAASNPQLVGQIIRSAAPTATFISVCVK